MATSTGDGRHRSAISSRRRARLESLALLSGDASSVEARLLRGLALLCAGELEGVGERGGESGESVDVEVGRVGGGEGDGDVKAVLRRWRVRVAGGVSGWKRLCRMVFDGRVFTVVVGPDVWWMIVVDDRGMVLLELRGIFEASDDRFDSFGHCFRVVVGEKRNCRTDSIKRCPKSLV